MKLTPKIILEGTRLTLKTDIAFALNEHPAITGPRKYRYHSPLISAEWCTFTNFPWGRGLINFQQEESEKAMLTYQTWAQLFELQRYYSWIIDRFHISTQMHQILYNKANYNFEWLEEKLAALDFRVIFCIRSEDSFHEAREQRLKVSGNPGQYDNLHIFLDEQKLLHELVSKSKLKSYIVDVSDNNIERICNDIAHWMDISGGLYSHD
ncbi:MAG: hypothetical protein LWX56_03070 [Ignavibacteria bacterium]|nr:hypothetical protein [Ignavibacteria bacterium]